MILTRLGLHESRLRLRGVAGHTIPADKAALYRACRDGKK
jgi:hypothetical protein